MSPSRSLSNRRRFIANATATVLAAVAVASAACHQTSPSTAAAAAPPTQTAASAAAARPAGVSDAMIALGDSIFNNGSCQKCHGPGGGGTARGPNLTDQTW